VVIVGDGDALYDPIFGRARPTLAEMDAWRVVVLLTPVPRWRWSWRERRLAEAGLIVLPATPEGIRLLGDFLRTEGRPPRPGFERIPRRAGPLALEGRDSIRWHSDRVPDGAEREAILDAIALELTPGAFELMCVVALFPELRPDLALHAAQSLKGPRGEPLVDDAGFAALAALPWFRLGRIPDWLRLELVRSLRPERKEEAHRMFAAWLSATDETAAGVQITAETLGRAVIEDAIRNPAGAVRDVIFLRFCNREDLSDIDLEVTDALSHAVGVQAFRNQHISFVAAIAVSTVLLGLGFLFGSDLEINSALAGQTDVFLFSLVGLQLVGLVGGIWRAPRGYAGISGQHGLFPLAVSIIGLPLSALIAFSDEALLSLALLIPVPCLAMGIAPLYRFIPFPKSTVSFERATSDLHSVTHIGHLFPIESINILFTYVFNIVIYFRELLLPNAFLILPWLLLAAATTIFLKPNSESLHMRGTTLPEAYNAQHFGASLIVFFIFVLWWLTYGLWRTLQVGRPNAEIDSRWLRVGAIMLIVLLVIAFCELQPLVLDGMFKAANQQGGLFASLVGWLQTLTLVLLPFPAAAAFFRRRPLTQQDAERPSLATPAVRVAGRVAIYIGDAAIPYLLWMVYLNLCFIGIKELDPGYVNWSGSYYHAPAWLSDVSQTWFGYKAPVAWFYLLTAIILFVLFGVLPLFSRVYRGASR
jgi:hypothetical protein